MNTTANTSYSSEHSWLAPGSRRGSIESILSIQGKETDFIRDTTDTEGLSDEEQDLEYEPVTESEDDAPIGCDSSGESDNELIATKVLEVKVGDDGDLEFADSEQTDSDGDDSEIDLFDYWKCAQCRTENNNPLYRYCEKCFKVRKNFFPPRPKPKQRCKSTNDSSVPISVHHLNDSGVDTASNSQELSQSPDSEIDKRIDDVQSHSQSISVSQSIEMTLDKNVVDKPQGNVSLNYVVSQNDLGITERPSTSTNENNTLEILDKREDSNSINMELLIMSSENKSNNESNKKVVRASLKRRAESADRNRKRIKIDYSDSDTESSDCGRTRKSKSLEPVSPLTKAVSDPSVTIDESINVSSNDNMCIICVKEPKSGVFVHGRIAHICCCYKCAVKVWTKSKRCPVCNCKVSNVLKAVVM